MRDDVTGTIAVIDPGFENHHRLFGDLGAPEPAYEFFGFPAEHASADYFNPTCFLRHIVKCNSFHIRHPCYLGSESLVNGNGRSAFAFVNVDFPRLFERTISIFPARSRMTCRHAPQGEMNPSRSDEIAIALNLCLPSLNALNRAVRSAQIVRLNELLSMLQPEIISPDVVSSAAPTRNREDGE